MSVINTNRIARIEAHIEAHLISVVFVWPVGIKVNYSCKVGENKCWAVAGKVL